MTNKEKLVSDLIANKINITSFEYEMGKLGVHVVKPQEAAVAAFYTDERRYFPTVNEFDVVVGGYFG